VSAAASAVGALEPEIVRVLREAFGDEPVTEITALKGGLSGATLLSLEVAGKGYVLRRGEPSRVGREIACMTIAAGSGVAPAIHHIDAAAGVTIVDRVEGRPLGGSAALATGRIERLARTLRRLHEGPAFPPGNSLGAVRELVGGILRTQGESALISGLLRTVEAATAATARFDESAPCHNDLNPNNILETEDATLLVDWESAGNSDPFFDLAQLGVFAFPRPEQQVRLLAAYLDREPSAEESARAVVSRVVALGFYGALFLVVAQRQGGAPAPLGAPRPLLEMLQTAGSMREQTPPGALAASLLGEMQREAETEAFASARRRLTTHE
jgi:aminoglycoside phosphotransferase (APT) family kinase protein